MNKELKKALKEGFEIPAPAGKKEFLHNIQPPPVRSFEFVVTQAAYIRKWIWGLSFLIYFIAFIGSWWIEKDMLWCISAFMPILALSIITECGRSEIYGMTEFELSTRFSLKSVVLARLGIISISTLVLLFAVIPLVNINSKVTFLQTGVYMTSPYLLTVFLGFWVVRKVRDKEGLYLCVGIAIVVSLGNIIVSQTISSFYEGQNFIWWVMILAALCIGTPNQCYKMIKQTEELVWS